MKDKRTILIGIILVVVAAFVWYVVAGREKATVFSSDTTIEGDYSIVQNEKTVLENDAKLTVTGNLDVSGTLTCDGGGVSIDVKGDLSVGGTVACSGQEDGAPPVLIVVDGSVVFGDNAVVEADGDVQVVGSNELFVSAEDDRSARFEEIGSPACNGVCIGPFVPEDGGSARTSSTPAGTTLKTISAVGTRGVFTIPAAEASSHTITPTGDTVRVSGTWRIRPPRPGENPLVLFLFPNIPNLELRNLTVDVPPGADGVSDLDRNCDSKGTDGKKAGRLLFWGQNVRLNNVTFNLGDGGFGGDARTKDDCRPKGTAKGGNGGESGKLKILGGTSIAIEGTVTINPGDGGDGGNAEAFGGDGQGPGEPGGDAEATGGNGADNIKQLRVTGAVSGTSFVQIGSALGGNGGDASASPGNGGDGDGCASDGGPGGNGAASGGAGGAAKVTLGGSAGSTADWEDRGGRGGDADTAGGEGGEGGDCGPEGPGGNGGKGGDATADAGAGGSGDPNGEEGTVLNEIGGNGGNGGDGCPEGDGGSGGNGNPQGEDGSPGRNLCVVQQPATSVSPPSTTGTTTNPPPSTTTTTPPPSTTTPPPPSQPKVSVIRYGSKYLPVSQLIVENEGDCGDHYHAAQGVVTATDGTQVPDPGPPCGYGAVATTPVILIDAPA